MSNYVYQRRGGPLLDWNGPLGRPPYQARAADATSLGAWAPIRPGAPEVIGDDAVADKKVSMTWVLIAGTVAWYLFKRR
jgi:hypothetical protein